MGRNKNVKAVKIEQLHPRSHFFFYLFFWSVVQNEIAVKRQVHTALLIFPKALEYFSTDVSSYIHTRQHCPSSVSTPKNAGSRNRSNVLYQLFKNPCSV